MMKNVIKVVVCLALVVVAFLLCFDTVPKNSVGIKIRAGVIQDEALSEGWKFKIPFVDKIDSMPTGVKMTEISAGTKNATTTVTAETADRQLVPVYDFEIYHRLSAPKAFEIYKMYGKNYDEPLIASNGGAIIRQVFSLYHSEELVSSRQEIPEKVREMLNEITAPIGVEIVRVNMKSYDFSPEYTAILEERAALSAQVKNNEIKQNNERIKAQTAQDVAIKAAETEAETARIKAENEKNVALIQANTKAETAKIQADNEAYVTITRANAERDAKLADVEAQKAELEAQASGINDKIIVKSFIEKWNGQLIPNFGDSGSLNFMNLTDIMKPFVSVPQEDR